MAISLAEFADSLIACGLMSADELRQFFFALPQDRRPGTAADLAKELFRAQKLTKYQAQSLYQGKTRILVLGNYVVLDRLGRGGMAQVFKAQHRRMQRIVALKVLPPEMIDSEDSIHRFQQEVKAVARLSHPNIVTAYDADEANGVHFLVMECVEGDNLLTLVREYGPLSVPKAVACVLQAARGLDYAHNEGIIHRDIKPSNLLLDRRGTIKILDLGLASIREPIPGGDDGRVEFVQAGYVLGSVDYMSPEQSCDMKSTDQRSDIYSLGCTLHFLLTGRSMYRGDTYAQKVLAHREGPIPSLREHRRDLPEGLEAVYRKMVAKKPKERQQSMAEVVADLQGFTSTAQLKGPGPLVRLSAGDDAAGTLDWLEEASDAARMPTLDELLVDEPSQPIEPLPSAYASFLRGRVRRRRLTTLAAMAGVALVTWLLFGVLLRPRTREGLVVLEVVPSGCTVRVLDAAEREEVVRTSDMDVVSLLVEPGQKKIQVKKDGYRPFSETISVEPNARVRIKAELKPSG